MPSDSELLNATKKLKSEMEFLSTKMDSLDTTMNTVATKMDTLDTTMSAVDANVIVLDGSITSLITVMNTLSDRYVNPRESFLAVQGATEEFELKPIVIYPKSKVNSYKETFAFVVYDPTNEIFYGMTYWMVGIGLNFALYTFNETDSTMTQIWIHMGAGGLVVLWDMAFDTSTSKLYVVKGDETVWGTGVAYDIFEISTTDGSFVAGTGIDLNHPTVNVDDVYQANFSPTDNKWYALIDGRALGTVFCSFDISTGLIDDYVSITDLAGVPESLFFCRGYVTIYDNAADTLKFYVPFAATDAKTQSSPPSSVRDCAYNLTTNALYGYGDSTSQLYLAKAFPTARVAITDDGKSISVDDAGGNLSIDDGGNVISVDDAGASLTVDGSVIAGLSSATNIATNNVVIGAAEGLIITTRANRRGLIIYNADTTNTLYVGATGLAVASSHEVLPKSSVAINNYGGAVYGIASGAGTDVRFIEVW